MVLFLLFLVVHPLLLSIKAASASPAPGNYLRAPSSSSFSGATAAAATSSNITSPNSKNIVVPDLADLGRSRSLLEIPTRCLDLLTSSANRDGALHRENYFVFTDRMADGCFTFNGIHSYVDLPMKNKIAFNFLSCQCHEFGGRENCCQGDQARIDLKDAAVDPASMNEEIRAYVLNICFTTEDAIGDERLPPGREARSYCLITEDAVGSDDGLPLMGELTNTNITIANRPDDSSTSSTEALHGSASDIDRPAANTDGGEKYVSAATSASDIDPPAADTDGGKNHVAAVIANEISYDEDNNGDGTRPRAGALGGIVITGGIITCSLLVLFATTYRHEICEKDDEADYEDGEETTTSW